MLIAISREKEKVSFVVSAKGFLWLQNQILLGILSIIIYKADGSTVFVVVKLKPQEGHPRAVVGLGQM